MYPGTHFSGGLGAAECPGALATGEQLNSNTHSDTYANSNSFSITYTNTERYPHANADPYSNSIADSHSFGRRQLCRAVELSNCLQRRPGSQYWRQ